MHIRRDKKITIKIPMDPEAARAFLALAYPEVFEEVVGKASSKSGLL